MKFEDILPHLRAKAGRQARDAATGVVVTSGPDGRISWPSGVAPYWLRDSWQLVPEAESQPKSPCSVCGRATGGCCTVQKAAAPEIARTAMDDPEWYRDNGPGKPLEPKSLGRIAWEAFFPNRCTGWELRDSRDQPKWEATAQAVRAEVLREAHRELTTDECLRVSDHCDGTSVQVTAAVRKADELRAKR